MQDALMIKPVHKVFKDHFGRKFETATDMCRYHGVSYSLYLNRLKSGKSLEEALNPHNKEKYIDHLGNVFNTQKEMCAFHGVSENTYYQRLRAGKTIEEALCKAAIYYKKDSDGKIFCRTKKEKQTLKREWFDHLGNKFSTLDEMCAFHGVERHAFTRDIKKCVSLKEALTPKVSVKVRCTDHLGNEFESITEMCKHHGITLSQYESRKRSDWPLERILSKGDYARRKTCTDHLGNVFESEIKMCQHWGVSDKTYRHRIIYDGWSLEKALTTKDIYTCTDHLGNVYKSKVEMAEHWGQKKGVIKDRLKLGWGIREALIIPNNTSKVYSTSGKKVLFEIDGISYYAFKCPCCNNEYAFTKEEIRSHYANHFEKGDMNEH